MTVPHVPDLQEIRMLALSARAAVDKRRPWSSAQARHDEDAYQCFSLIAYLAQHMESRSLTWAARYQSGQSVITDGARTYFFDSERDAGLAVLLLNERIEKEAKS